MTTPVLPPTPRDSAIQAALDENHLRLLEIAFYISGVMTALVFFYFCFIAFFFAIASLCAVFSSHSSDAGSGNVPPVIFFLFFALIWGGVIFFMLIFTGLEFYAGWCLKKRRHPVVIQIVAGLYCMSIPWGTALGVSTFLVLNRPSVKALFTPV